MSFLSICWHVVSVSVDIWVISLSVDIWVVSVCWYTSYLSVCWHELSLWQHNWVVSVTTYKLLLFISLWQHTSYFCLFLCDNTQVTFVYLSVTTHKLLLFISLWQHTSYPCGKTGVISITSYRFFSPCVITLYLSIAMIKYWTSYITTYI